MLAGISVLAAAEAMVMGTRLGVAKETLYEVISTSTGTSYMFDNANPMPDVVATAASSRGFTPGFMAKLMLKDLRLSQQAAEAVDADTPMGRTARDLYAQFVEAEDGRGQDFSAMLPRFEKRGRG